MFIREITARHQQETQALKDEIARLKGHKTKPDMRPSRLEPPKPDAKQPPDGKRPGSNKRSKTAMLEIHETLKIAPQETIPPKSRFKGYADYTVIGLRFQPHNVRYRLEVWETPDGQRLAGQLPALMAVLDGHCSPELVGYILHQHHHAHVPQGLIWEQLQDIGVPISEGQVNHILLDYSGPFHQEKENLLKVGLEVSRHIHVDDTGARHKGKNGYCTQIGNEWFTYFESTESKSRINFLRILRAGHTDYLLQDDAWKYMEGQQLSKTALSFLKAVGEITVPDDCAWQEALNRWGITQPMQVRIVTEGALLGSVLHHGIHPELVIVSDDAGQFNVLLHALCWIHAERTLAKLVGFNEDQRQALEAKRTEVWEFYRDLKTYKVAPSDGGKRALSTRFDAIFTATTCFATLNCALERLRRNKAELLLVLKRPDVPLHNNLSENDIREYVTRRKRSGSTRSDLGRRCRDTFASLKKTCRKLRISFWRYLLDRFSGANSVPRLSDLVRQRAQEAKALT